MNPKPKIRRILIRAQIYFMHKNKSFDSAIQGLTPPQLPTHSNPCKLISLYGFHSFRSMQCSSSSILAFCVFRCGPSRMYLCYSVSVHLLECSIRSPRMRFHRFVRLRSCCTFIIRSFSFRPILSAIKTPSDLVCIYFMYMYILCVLAMAEAEYHTRIKYEYFLR